MKRLKTILLIDDDAPTLFLNKLVIQDLDCTDKILTAENGRQAIEMLTEETDQGFLCPDLILLDINMPIVNGWEFMDKYQSLSAEQKQKLSS